MTSMIQFFSIKTAVMKYISYLIFVFCLFVSFPVNVLAQVDVEAQQEANRWVNTRFFTHSNGDTFSRITSRDYYGNTNYSYHQINNFRFSVIKSVPSKADILNGIEWMGKIRLEADASRWLYYNSTPMRWGEWGIATIVEINFKKKRGTWRFVNSGFGWAEGDSVPSLEQIQTILNYPMVDS